MLLSGFLELIRRERLLVKLISSFLAASVVSVVLVSGILFAAYDRRSMRDLAAVTQLALAETANRLDRTFTQAADIAFLVFKDPDVVSLMYTDGKDPLNLVRITAFVQNLMASDPYIDSVALCGRDTVLLSTSQSGETGEPPQTILSLARMPKVLVPKPRLVQRANGGLVSLLTLAINESNSPNYVDSAVVVNLDADAIRKDLGADAAEAPQTIVVVDDSATVLLGSNAAGFGTSIADEPYMRRIAEDPRSSGFFLTEAKGRRYAVSFARAANDHYTAISLTDYARYTAGISGLRGILLAASGGILIAVLGFGLVLSLRLYVPLNALFDGIRSRVSASPEPRRNELEYVSGILARAMDAFSAAEHAADNDRMVVSALLRDLLTGPSALDPGDLEEELRRRNVIPDQPGRFVVAVLRIDGVALLRRKLTAEAIRFQMASTGGIAAETLKSRVSCVPTQAAEDLVALLLFVPDRAARWWQSHAAESLLRVQEAVRRMLGIELTLAMGDPVATLREARSSYRRAEALTLYRLVLPKNELITAESVQGFRDEPMDERGIEDTFRGLMRSTDRPAFASAVDRLVGACRGLRIERQFEAFQAAARAAMTAGVGVMPPEGDSRSAAHMDAAIRSAESYDEMKEWLLSLYDANQKKLRELGSSRSADFLQKALDFIDKNYADSQLSANLLADKLAITPQYFSRLFNESVGSSFPEYLMGLRLEKARALLLSVPRLTIDEICRRVGLGNRTYFATAFKRRFGVSPATFRQAGAASSLS